MSYCRAGSPHSDVYICGTMGDHGRRRGWTCYSCGCMYIRSRRDLLRHMIAHLRKGDKVPAYATDRVINEILFSGRK